MIARLFGTKPAAPRGYTGHVSSQSWSVVSSLDARRARRDQRDPSDALLDIASELLARGCYADVSLAAVAARAGITGAALSAHYPTKDALIAGIYLRRLRALPLESGDDAAVVDRLSAQVQALATMFADQPRLGAACTTALMRNDDPAIAPVRAAISTEMRRRIAAALGPGAWPEVHNTLETVICGALLQLGAGMLSHRRMFEHVDTMFGLLLPDDA